MLTFTSCIIVDTLNLLRVGQRAVEQKEVSHCGLVWPIIPFDCVSLRPPNPTTYSRTIHFFSDYTRFIVCYLQT